MCVCVAHKIQPCVVCCCVLLCVDGVVVSSRYRENTTFFRVHILNSHTNMNDELRQVKDDIRDTRADLAKAKREGKENLIETYGKLLATLYNEKALVESRLSAGEIYYNRGLCDIVWFLTLLFSVSNCL
jgi:hypothetical protein